MVLVDHGVLGEPGRVAAVGRARRSAAGMPVRFDAVARMAARLTRAPTAVISLVSDDYDDLLGSYGLPDRYAHRRRWPMPESLCQYVICHGSVLAVPDMAADDGLRSHPLTAEVGVCAFAGAPLHDEDGRLVGSVTVVDFTPRVWSAADLAALNEIVAVLEPIPTEFDAAAGMASLGEASTSGAAATAVSPAVAAEVRRVFINALMDNLPIGVIALDEQRRPVLGNRALRELTDHPADAPLEEVMASLPGRVRHPDGTPMELDELPLFAAFAGGGVHTAEVVLLGDGRSERRLCGTSAPIVGPAGEYLGAVSTATDVTEQRRSEQALHAQGRVAILLNRADVLGPVLPEVLGTMATALRWPYVSLWLVDDVGDILRHEQRWTATGAGADPDVLQPDEGLVGRAWQQRRTLSSPEAGDLWPAADMPGAANCAAIAAPINDGERVVGVLACLSGSADGDTAQLESAGEQIGHFIARRRVADLGMQLLHAKDDFVALVGHELRTPVTSIASSVELLQADGYDDDGPRLLDTIRRNADTLRLIIDDLLEMAQLESQTEPLRFTPVDLAAVVAAAVPHIPAGTGPRVHTNLPPALTIDGDPGRLAQVAGNLLSNAVKYTPAGGDVHVSLEADGDVAVLAVADTGIGVPPDERDNLFRRFYRASNARNSVSVGTGLGLVMVRTIVEAHRGTIQLDTGYEGGTRFVVRLPVRRAGAAPPAAS